MKTIKKWVITLLASVAFLSVGLVGLKYVTADKTGEWVNIVDQLNPFVTKSESYVKTTKPVTVNGYGTAAYHQEAVFENGKTRPIEFSGLSVLKVDHYLKLIHKGAHVITYEEVAEQEVPRAALEKLKKY